MMQDYEKLGAFYLGRHYDLKKKRSKPELLLYESKHLVTHGLVVGMTGSGKTGLCFDIIEEAAIDGIPAIVVDPKGDLGNLLLTFPELRAQDFAPWVNEDDASKQGLSVADYAARQAELWKKGLAAWDQDGERIGRLRAATVSGCSIAMSDRSSTPRMMILPGSFARIETSRFDCAVSIETCCTGECANSGRNE